LSARSRDPILVLGCGAVGASAAAGWSLAGHEVWGSDRRDLGPLVERGWLRRQVGVESLFEAATVVLALPVGGITGALRRLPFHDRQVVTDVGSVKGAILEAAASSLAPGVAFVGGHPMAGSEGSGYEAAHEGLFAGATWALCGSGDALGAVAALVRELGAQPLVCEAEAHDRAVALTSHVPQLLASALAAELEARATSDDEARLLLALLGQGGRGMLRLAGSSYEVWRDILVANREEIEHALAAVRDRAAQPPESQGEDFTLAKRFFARIR
jgi:prephenate dehydrogenase